MSPFTICLVQMAVTKTHSKIDYNVITTGSGNYILWRSNGLLYIDIVVYCTALVQMMKKIVLFPMIFLCHGNH